MSELMTSARAFKAFLASAIFSRAVANDSVNEASNLTLTVPSDTPS